jgi:glycosyltransferase involved in cell wall biosynthesis
METIKPCVIIPAYNEEVHIASVIRGVKQYVEKVFVIDDGSADSTVEIARRASAEVIRHEINLGKGVSLKDGFARAFKEGYDPVIVIDADAQHDPRELPGFIDAYLKTGADIVVGNRMGNTAGMPLIRYLTNRFTSFVVSAFAKQRIPDSQCGYRLINKKAFNKMNLMTGRFDTEGEMLIQAGRDGCRIVSVPVSTIYGLEKSSINPLVDTFRFFGLVIRSVRGLFRND